MTFRAIISGTAMISSVRMFRLATQFIAIPILARLLTPAEFGLVAIAMPFCLFAMMIADAGIGTSLVRTPLSDRRAWSTCFWLTSLLGALLGLILAALSPLVAYLFNEHVIGPMVAALGFVVFAQSIHLIPVAALQQASRFKVIASIELIASLFSTGVTLWMAYHGYGAWSLIAQQLSFFAVRVTSVCILSPFRPRWIFDWRYVREHIIFGRNVLGTMLVNYFGRSFDNLVVGKALGTSLLGIYSMSFQFARLPLLLLSSPLQYVMYAQLVKIKDDKAAIGRVFLVMTRLLAILIFPAMGMVAAAHEPIFTALLSHKWAQVGVIFVLITPATALQAVMGIGETMCYALNRTDIQLRTSTEFALLWIVTLIVAVSFGLTYAALAYTGCVLVYQQLYLRRVTALIEYRLKDYFATYLLPLGCMVTAMAIYTALTGSIITNMWLQLALASALCLSAMAAAFLLQRKRIMEEIKQLKFKTADSIPPLPESSPSETM